MPSEGIELSPKEHILTDDEIIRLATLFVRSGVTKIRLTGGEPTVRKGLVELVGMLLPPVALMCPTDSPDRGL
jgi:molybdenum cofactor biosynthesis enzyme MoaA